MFALKNLRPTVPPTLGILLSTSLLLLLAGCSKEAPKQEDVRPVRAIVVGSSDVDVNAEFAGEVRPRVESRMGFRVGGKIIARKVDVGTVVERGQVLMQLDPQDLRLTQTQARASFRAAESQRNLARDELKRYEELRKQNFVSQAVLDARKSAYAAAQANYDAARAGFAVQVNQAQYSTLVSDTDGVVTAISAEVGQVVAPGTPVVSVANTDDKEIVISLPEDKVDAMREVQNVTVRMWANPAQAIPGVIREVSPVADPATRTYSVRVSIPNAGSDIKLGMTARVQFASKSATPQMRLPLTALFNAKSSSAVWVVEKGAVRMAPVKVGGAAGNDVIIASGIQPGQTVVTAGVNKLKSGQKVKILADGMVPAAAAGAAK